jgi:hypothetical protein
MLPDDVRALALMLPDAVAGAHMGNPDFRVHGRIFATLWTEEDRVVVKLTPEIQAAMIEAEPDLFEPIPGSWGRRGWTNLDFTVADAESVRSALLAAWQNVAPPGLVAEFSPGPRATADEADPSQETR